MWNRRAVPTNAELECLCCGSDGKVYITTSAGDVIVGRESEWRLITQDQTDDPLEAIVDYRGRILLTTENAIFAVSQESVVPADLGEPALSSKAHIAARDGLLLLAGRQDAAVFDGESWTVILEPTDRPL
jgi:hypothetical protein